MALVNFFGGGSLPMRFMENPSNNSTKIPTLWLKSELEKWQTGGQLQFRQFQAEISNVIGRTTFIKRQ